MFHLECHIKLKKKMENRIAHTTQSLAREQNPSKKSNSFYLKENAKKKKTRRVSRVAFYKLKRKIKLKSI